MIIVLPAEFDDCIKLIEEIVMVICSRHKLIFHTIVAIFQASEGF